MVEPRPTCMKTTMCSMSLMLPDCAILPSNPTTTKQINGNLTKESEIMVTVVGWP